MEEIEGYKFGQVYTKKISPEDADKFSKVFGEGSPALTELIKYCILNNIITHASCKGHPEEKNVLERLMTRGYITFSFDSDYSDLAYFLASIPLVKKGIEAHLEQNMQAGRTITLYVPAKAHNMSEEYFRFILEMIKEYQNIKNAGKNINIDPHVEQLVYYTFHPYNLNNIAYEISFNRYTKYERNGMYLKKVGKCPSNNNTGILHKRFGDALKKTQKFDEFIRSSSRRR